MTRIVTVPALAQARSQALAAGIDFPLIKDVAAPAKAPKLAIAQVMGTLGSTPLERYAPAPSYVVGMVARKTP